MGLFDNLFKRVDLDALAVGAEVVGAAKTMEPGDSLMLPPIRFSLGKKRFVFAGGQLVRLA